MRAQRSALHRALETRTSFGACSLISYDVAKFVHITGVVMLMGNITVTAIWKFFADRDGRPDVLAFAQKLVTYTEWSMTVWGLGLLLGGGYFMAFSTGLALNQGWLLWSQVLFGLSGSIWLLALVPIQIRQAGMAKRFCSGDVIDRYRVLSKHWLAWGVTSTLPLIAVLWLMVAKAG